MMERYSGRREPLSAHLTGKTLGWRVGDSEGWGSDNERQGKEWREAAGTFCIQPLIRKIRSVKGGK